MQEHFQIIVKQIAARRHKQAAPYVLLASILAAMALVAGCGGGGGGGGGSSAPPPPTIIVQGVVTDNFTGVGAPNVTVTIQGQANPNTVTDANGNYSLAGVPENTTVTLLFNDVSTCESETFQVTTTTVSPLTTNTNPPAHPFIIPTPNCAG